MSGKILQKEKFIKIMNDIREARRLEDDFLNFIWNHSKSTGIVELPTSTDTALDLLAFIFDDNESLIDYYVYELSCGENYKPDMIHNGSGNNMQLATPEDLYNLLIKELEDR